MSITDDVNAWFGEPKLVEVFPEAGRKHIRHLYLTVHINERLLGMHAKTVRLAERWTQLSVELLDFVHGDELRLPNKKRPRPRKDESAVKLLEPCDLNVWQLRSNDRPPIRILGRFREKKDHFVGLAWRYRCQLRTPEEWAAAKQECIDAWDGLHLGIPLIGDYPDGYLTRTILVPR